jgi:hypothetical protein
MKRLKIITRRVFFFGSFALAAVALLEKLMNAFHFALLRNRFPAQRLLEFTAIGLLFVIVMQLEDIRLALGAKSSDLPK